MAHRVVSLAFASLILGLAPGGAGASLPPYYNTTVPACISLVGSDGTTAGSIGTFQVVVRDLANNPMPGREVRVDLTNAPDLRLCAQQLAPGVTVDCPMGTARGTTDENGRVQFTLLGGGLAMTTGTLTNGGRIYVDGTLVGSPTVSAYDLDGQGGVGANDISLWLSDFASGQPYGRSDYDCSGDVGANDFSFMLTAFGSSTQTISCAASCP
jgi:hypothetical protein